LRTSNVMLLACAPRAMFPTAALYCVPFGSVWNPLVTKHVGLDSGWSHISGDMSKDSQTPPGDLGAYVLKEEASFEVSAEGNCFRLSRHFKCSLCSQLELDSSVSYHHDARTMVLRWGAWRV
jgi:hypothetical protein